jgi:hypothetical protein
MHAICGARRADNSEVLPPKNQICCPSEYVPVEHKLAPSCEEPVPIHLVPLQVPSAAARRTSKHRRLDPRIPDDVAASYITLS